MNDERTFDPHINVEFKSRTYAQLLIQYTPQNNTYCFVYKIY